MDFQQVVQRRRMVRGFQGRPLPADIVERILRNARRAPSAGFSQGWAFLVCEGAADTARYWAAVGPATRATFPWPHLFEAPLLVVCLANKSAYLDRYAEADKGWDDRDEARWPAPYWDIDTGMAALLMLLTAVDAGLGGLFFGIPPAKVERLRTAFGVPPDYKPIGTVAIGYARTDDAPSRSVARGRRSAAEVVHRGRW